MLTASSLLNDAVGSNTLADMLYSVLDFDAMSLLEDAKMVDFKFPRHTLYPASDPSVLSGYDSTP